MRSSMSLKKITAALLTVLMLLSLQPATLADVPATTRILPNTESLPNVGSVYNDASGVLTYYLTAEPVWRTEVSGEFIRLVTGIVMPDSAATYMVNGDGPFPTDIDHPTQGFGVRYDKPAGAAQTYNGPLTVTWYDSGDALLATDTITVRIVPAYEPQPVPKDKLGHPDYDDDTAPQCLNVSGIQAEDGMLMYRLKKGVAPEAGDSVTTYVSLPDAAHQYKLDGGALTPAAESYISVPDVIPALDDALPQSDFPHTVQWYNGDGSILVATQSFKTRFKLSAEEKIEPFDYDGLDKTHLAAIGCSSELGTITDEDGKTQQCLDITLPQKNAEQWKALFFGPYNSASGADSFSVRTSFTFPANTKWFARIGARLDLGDAHAIYTLKNIPSGFRLDPLNDSWSFGFASVTYDGANAILSPQEGDHSLLIKYMDKDDELHYTRFNYRIRYGSPDTSYVMENVTPLGSRVIADPRFNGTYGDGTVTYTISSYDDGPLGLVTRIAPPAAISAAKLSVNGEAPIDILNGYADYSYLYNGGRQQFTAPLKLEWLDGEDSVLFTEMMSINIIPAFSGKWVDALWQPVAESRTSAHANAIAAGAKLVYDPAEGVWRFTIDESKLSDLNTGYFTGDYSDLITVAPPANAVYYIWYMAHDPLYAQGFETGAESYFLGEEANGRYEPVPKNGASIPLPYRQPCSTTAMDATNGDVTVFTVNKTMTGYANYAVFQWYDSDKNLIVSGGDRGEYVLLIMDPFYRSSSSPMTAAPVSATAQTGPTAVSDRSGSLSYALKTETPLQKNGSANTDYLVMNLVYLDESGKEVQPAAGETVTVYLPYPDGVSYQTANQYVFTLRHYKSGDLNGGSKLVELVPTAYGLRFHTDSFSPFLRSCIKKTVNTGENNAPSFRVTYSGGNVFDTNGTVKKAEVDGVETPFVQNGSALTLSRLTDGARTVRITFSDGSVVVLNTNASNTSAAIGIPQTGDDPAASKRIGISFLAAAALTAGILPLRKKKES